MRSLALPLTLALAGCASTEEASVVARDAALDRPAADVPAAVDRPALPDDRPALPDVAVDATASDVPAAQPVVSAVNEWAWVDVPESRCANGTPTGFGVNRAASSDTVVLFLQGGGACWDALTCLGPVSTSFYVATGYDRLAFQTDALRVAMLPMRRLDPTNPFRGMHLVYVPYCTGDVHAGDRVSRYSFLGRTADIHHVGYRNLGQFIPRVRATFPGVRRVILMGDSAGGFGAALNMDRVQRAFPDAVVDVLDDSGPPVRPDPARWSAWRASWNIQLPEGCNGCEGDITAVVRALQARYPQRRFGLISYTHDAIISTFMNVNAFQFWDELRAVGEALPRTWPGARTFFLPGVLHVGMLAPTPALVRWMDAFAREDPAWASEGP